MSAEWWQNFANNFATDLAPLISLFGESPTKQYLSETLTFVDVFIFCMAPIGVLTALVSAIRVAGGPSLRAFIGRAQEGAGMAEAELCSSTSRNVCELYNNGGIARVFGRPKILEFVHDWEGKSEPQPNEESWKPRNETEIYSFREYVNRGHWRETGAKADFIRNDDEESRPGEDPVRPIQYSANDFAPHPNLSLNVGIKKLPRISFYLAAVLGFVLQAGVLVYAGLITYKYPNRFKRDDSQITVPAFPFACAGTVLVCIGVGMCASIIERTTYEKTFERTKDTSRLYWIQPGDQIVGDQVFDCFAYSDAKNQIKEYTTSKREVDRDNDTKRFLAKQSFLVWVASFATTIGFALQFLGLRALHSTVSVAQFGAILIMSTVRASLRTRRLKEEDNLLGNSSTLYLGHELDWLAMEMAQEDQSYSARGVPNQTSKPFWHVAAKTTISPQKDNFNNPKNNAVRAYRKRTKLAQMTGALSATSTIAVKEPWQDSMIASRTWAAKLACAIEGIMKTINLRCTVKDSLSGKEFIWHLRCWMDTAPGASSSKSGVSITIARDNDGIGLHGPWKADRAQLEGILGLWLWSIISTERIRQINERDSPEPSNSVTRTARLITVLEDSDSSDSAANLKLWLGNNSASLRETTLKSTYASFSPGRLWVEQGDGYVVRDEDTRKKQDHDALRFFGSNVIPAEMAAKTWGDPPTVLYMASTSFLEMMCAQELFAIFFTIIAPKIEEIRGSTEIVEGTDRLHVVNSTLSEMVEIFTSSGIGNHDDAIACMVPVLHSARKLSISSTFMAARAAGEEYHRRNDWKRAKDVLFSALKLALQDFDGQVMHLPGDTERTAEIHVCLLSLCELYRWALLGDKRTRLFGLRGFVSLFKLFYQRRPTRADDSIVDQGEIPERLLLYWTVALNLSKEERDNRDILHAIQELR